MRSFEHAQEGCGIHNPNAPKAIQISKVMITGNDAIRSTLHSANKIFVVRRISFHCFDLQFTWS
jgi:hypothetical protein